jgi:hypothetical protein
MKLKALTALHFGRPIHRGAEFDCEDPETAHSLVTNGVAAFASVANMPETTPEVTAPEPTKPESTAPKKKK